MAKEEILVTFKIDDASLKAASKAVKRFAANMNKNLKLTPKINLNDLRSELSKVGQFINKAVRKINSNFILTPKVNTQSLSTLNVALGLVASNAKSAQIALSTMTTQFRKATGLAQSLAKATAAAAASANRVKSPATASAAAKGGKAGGPETGQRFASLSLAAGGATAALAKGISTFAEFETSLVRVGRLLNLNGQALRDFGSDMTVVATQLGIATGEVLALAEAAARVGVARQDIVEFATQTQKVAIALQLSGEEAAQAFRQYTLLFKLPIGNIINIGNAFNAVADASALSVASLQNTLKFLGPVAAQFRVTGQQGIASFTALGATLTELGISGEVISSGLSRIFTELIERAPEAARIAGVSLEEFKELAERDITQATALVAAGFQKLDVEARVAAKSLLGLTDVRVGRVFSALSENLDSVALKQRIATQAFKDGFSVQSEVARNSQTLTAQIQSTINVIQKAIVDAFEPYADTLKNALFAVREYIKENPEFVKQVIQVGAVVAAAIASLAGLALSVEIILAVINPLTAAVGYFATTIANLGTVAVQVATKLRILQVAKVGLRKSALLAAAAFGKSGGLASILAGLKVALAGAGTAIKGFFLAGFGKLAIVGAGVVSVIGLVVAAVARLAGSTAFDSFGASLERLYRKVPFLNSIRQAYIDYVNTVVKYASFGLVDKLIPDVDDLADVDAQIAKDSKSIGIFAEKTKDAAKKTNEFTQQLSEADATVKSFTSEQERFDFVQRAVTKSTVLSTAALQKRRNTEKDNTDSMGEFIEKSKEAQDAIVSLAAGGGLAVRSTLRQGILDTIASAKDLPTGLQAAADKLKQIAIQINQSLPEDRKLNLDIRADNVLDKVEVINEAVLELSTKLNGTTEEAKEFRVQFVAAQDVILNSGLISRVSDLKDETAALAVKFRVSDTAAVNFIQQLQAMNVNVKELVQGDGSIGALGQELFNAFGVNTIEDLKKTANALSSVNDRLKETIEAKGLAGKFASLGLDFSTPELALSSLVKAARNGLLPTLVEISDVETKNAKLRSDVLETLKARQRLDEEGLGALRKQSAELQRQINFLESKDFTGTALEREQQLLVVKEAQLDVEEKIFAKDKEITDSKKDESRVEKLLVELKEEQNKENAKILERSGQYNKALAITDDLEQKALDAIKGRVVSTEDLLEISKQIANVRLTKNYNELFAIVEKLRSSADSARDALNGLQGKQAKAKADLDSIIAPKASKTADVFKDTLEKVISDAAEGAFAQVNPDEFLKRASDAANQAAKEQAENEQETLENLLSKRVQNEETIAEKKAKLRELDAAQQLSFEERINKVIRKDRVTRADAEETIRLQDEKAARKRQVAVNDIAQAERERVKLAEDESKLRKEGANTQQEIAGSAQELEERLKRAYTEGAEKARKIKEEAEKTQKAFAQGSADLQVAAAALKDGVGGFSLAVAELSKLLAAGRGKELDQRGASLAPVKDKVADIKDSAREGSIRESFDELSSKTKELSEKYSTQIQTANTLADATAKLNTTTAKLNEARKKLGDTTLGSEDRANTQKEVNELDKQSGTQKQAVEAAKDAAKTVAEAVTKPIESLKKELTGEFNKELSLLKNLADKSDARIETDRLIASFRTFVNAVGTPGNSQGDIERAAKANKVEFEAIQQVIEKAGKSIDKERKVVEDLPDKVAAKLAETPPPAKTDAATAQDAATRTDLQKADELVRNQTASAEFNTKLQIDKIAATNKELAKNTQATKNGPDAPTEVVVVDDTTDEDTEGSGKSGSSDEPEKKKSSSTFASGIVEPEVIAARAIEQKRKAKEEEDRKNGVKKKDSKEEDDGKKKKKSSSTFPTGIGADVPEPPKAKQPPSPFGLDKPGASLVGDLKNLTTKFDENVRKKDALSPQNKNVNDGGLADDREIAENEKAVESNTTAVAGSEQAVQALGTQATTTGNAFADAVLGLNAAAAPEEDGLAPQDPNVNDAGAADDKNVSDVAAALDGVKSEIENTDLGTDELNSVAGELAGAISGKFSEISTAISNLSAQLKTLAADVKASKVADGSDAGLTNDSAIV